MQRLEVSGAVRPLQGSLGFKGLKTTCSLARGAKTSIKKKLDPIFQLRGIAV